MANRAVSDQLHAIPKCTPVHPFTLTAKAILNSTSSPSDQRTRSTDKTPSLIATANPTIFTNKQVPKLYFAENVQMLCLCGLAGCFPQREKYTST